MPSEAERGTSPIRVVLDAMGGDYGPEETVRGAVQALEVENIEVILVGGPEEVQAQLAGSGLAGKRLIVGPSDGKIEDG